MRRSELYECTRIQAIQTAQTRESSSRIHHWVHDSPCHKRVENQIRFPPLLLTEKGVLFCMGFANDATHVQLKEIRRSCADYLHQRSVHLILIHFPTTAGSAQFCLLCCQPEPIPGTLAARKHLLTQRVPCRLPVWSRMNHLHELQDIASSPTLHRQVRLAQEQVPNNRSFAPMIIP